MVGFRRVLWALIAIDVLVGGLMFVSPEAFAAAFQFPVRDVALARGYGERIVIIAAVLVWLQGNLHRAGRLVWVPLADETLNMLGDAYEWLQGTLPAPVVAPMLLGHAVFVVLLLVVTPRVSAEVRKEDLGG